MEALGLEDVSALLIEWGLGAHSAAFRQAGMDGNRLAECYRLIFVGDTSPSPRKTVEVESEFGALWERMSEREDESFAMELHQLCEPARQRAATVLPFDSVDMECGDAVVFLATESSTPIWAAAAATGSPA